MTPMTIESQDPRAVVDRLYSVLDPLAHPARMRALAAWTQTEVRRDGGGSAGQFRALLDTLDARGPHGRRLAVQAAVIGRDLT